MTATDLPLSNTMASALLEIEHAGGTVIRKPGGYWVLPTATWTGNGWGQWWITGTIEGLVRRGKLAYVEHQEGKHGKFPIKAQVVQA